MSRYDVLGRLSCSDCQVSPSSNDTYITLSVPANRSPACFVSWRITRAKLPLGRSRGRPLTNDVLGVAQIGGQLGPVHPAVGRGHHELESRDQLVLVPGREGQGLRDGGPAVQGRIDVGTHVDPLLTRVGDFQDPRAAGVDDVGV